MHKPPESIFDHLGQKPNAAETVGWELIDYSREDQWIRVSFIGRETFTNPMGFIQGGFLVAMLDEAMGSTVTAITDAKFFTSTISLSVDYMRPCKVGTVIGEGRVTYMGKSFAYLEGKLFNEDGKVIARSTASCRLVEINPKEVFAKKG